MQIIFNGQLLAANDPQAQISPLSAAVEFGQAVFETFRTRHQQLPANLKPHWERLFQSAVVLDFQLPSGLNQTALDTGVQVLMSTLNRQQDYRFKVVASADWWWIKAAPLPMVSPEIYEQGVLVDDVVQERLFPEAKMVSPLYPYYQNHQIKQGVFETLFFTPENQLLEGSVSGVIAVIEGALVSPTGPVLPSTTVRSVFAQAKALEIPARFESISRQTLQQATEIWLVNAVKGIVPVQRWQDWERQGTTLYEKFRDLG